MTEQQRLTIRAELARRMGWTEIFGRTLGQFGLPPDSPTKNALVHYYVDIPDPFTDAADKDALVAWMAADDERWARFDNALLDCLLEAAEPIKAISKQNNWLTTHQQWERLKLTAPLETITLAAARSLGILEASE